VTFGHGVPLYIMNTKYPFFLMAQLLNAKVLSHQKGVINTQELYESLEYVSEMLKKWNDEQFAE